MTLNETFILMVCLKSRNFGMMILRGIISMFGCKQPQIEHTSTHTHIHSMKSLQRVSKSIVYTVYSNILYCLYAISMLPLKDDITGL